MALVCCQMNMAWEDPAANFARAEALLAAKPPPPGSLVLLPELFATGFSMNVAALAEAPDGETAQFLSRTAQRFGVTILGGQATRSTGGQATRSTGGKGHNQAVAFDPKGHEVARYTKIHPFTPGGEARHFERGSRVVTFGWSGFTVAPFICYDLRFPELFRAATRMGATLFAVIANWPAARESHWVALLRARAIENQVVVAGVNRIGSDPNADYSGRSLIVDPRGEIVADARAEETLLHSTLDLAALNAYRRDFPVLADMDPPGALY